MRPTEVFEVAIDIQPTVGTEHDATSRDEEPEHMAVEACLWLVAYNDEDIQDFVECHSETQAMVEGTSLTPQTTKPGLPPQTIQPNKGLESSSARMSLPTQVVIPDWTQEATNCDDVTLSMSSLLEIDPANVIHYFTNVVK